MSDYIGIFESITGKKSPFEFVPLQNQDPSKYYIKPELLKPNIGSNIIGKLGAGLQGLTSGMNNYFAVDSSPVEAQLEVEKQNPFTAWDNNSLMSQLNTWTPSKTNYTMKDMGFDWGEQLGNIGSAAIGGLAAGGIGAAISGGLAAIGSVAGGIKAWNEAKDMNAKAKQNNILAQNNFFNQANAIEFSNDRLNKLNSFAEGGMMNLPEGLSFINEGGTHEQNPFGGVPMGVAEDGSQNLVEEGEVIYNDYVFSNRLEVPKELKDKYSIKDKSITFADAVKRLLKPYEDNMEDSINKRGIEAIMQDFIEAQEQVRVEKQTAESNVKYSGGPLQPLFGMPKVLDIPEGMTIEEFLNAHYPGGAKVFRKDASGMFRNLSASGIDNFFDMSLKSWVEKMTPTFGTFNETFGLRAFTEPKVRNAYHSMGALTKMDIETNIPYLVNKFRDQYEYNKSGDEKNKVPYELEAGDAEWLKNHETNIDNLISAYDILLSETGKDNFKEAADLAGGMSLYGDIEPIGVTGDTTLFQEAFNDLIYPYIDNIYKQYATSAPGGALSFPVKIEEDNPNTLDTIMDQSFANAIAAGLSEARLIKENNIIPTDVMQQYAQETAQLISNQINSQNAEQEQTNIQVAPIEVKEDIKEDNSKERAILYGLTQDFIAEKEKELKELKNSEKEREKVIKQAEEELPKYINATIKLINQNSEIDPNDIFMNIDEDDIFPDLTVREKIQEKTPLGYDPEINVNFNIPEVLPEAFTPIDDSLDDIDTDEEHIEIPYHAMLVGAPVTAGNNIVSAPTPEGVKILPTFRPKPDLNFTPTYTNIEHEAFTPINYSLDDINTDEEPINVTPYFTLVGAPVRTGNKMMTSPSLEGVKIVPTSQYNFNQNHDYFDAEEGFKKGTFVEDNYTDVTQDVIEKNERRNKQNTSTSVEVDPEQKIFNERTNQTTYLTNGYNMATKRTKLYTDSDLNKFLKAAPAAANAAALFQNAVTKADHEYANKIESAAEESSGITPSVITGKVHYNPDDSNYITSKQIAASNAARQGVLNTTNNAGAARATTLTSDNALINALGEIALKTREINWNKALAANQYNLGIDQYNAKAIYDANIANAQAKERYQDQRLKNLMTAASLRREEDRSRAASIGANTKALAENLYQLYKDEWYREQANKAIENGDYGVLSRVGTQVVAYGGPIKRKNKKRKKGLTY